MKADLGVVASYTEALFEAAKKKGVLDTLAENVRQIQKSLTPESQGRIKAVFESPNIAREKKEAVFVKLYGGRVDALFLNFVRMLIKRGRLEVYEPALELFLQKYDEHRGFLRAEVVTAVEPSAEEKQRMTSALNRSLGKTLLIDFKVDSSVIGGVRFKSGDILIDTTIARGLAALRTKLKGASVL
ncbi:ATP synthase F1 subunit delta [Candidatus Sumerlaeota bacterium]|nr:ATP synthase F1 subunit delta [Candidatus Sumerlaeota bacterium]